MSAPSNGRKRPCLTATLYDFDSKQTIRHSTSISRDELAASPSLKRTAPCLPAV